MTARLRLSLACAGLFFWAAVSLAADDAEVVIATKLDEKKLPVSVTDLDVRPNTKQPFYIFVKNISAVKQTFIVELAGVGGSPAPVSQRIEVAAGVSAQVEFKPEPPPKKDEPPRTPADAKKEADEALKAEPPTGMPMKKTNLDGKRVFAFTVRVQKEVLEDNKPVLRDAMAKERTVSVTILNPSTYIAEPVVTWMGSNGKRGLTATVADNRAAGTDVSPSIDVSLDFPPQLALKATNLGSGTYHRSISKTGQKVDLTAMNLPLTGVNVPARFYITVDKYPRTFTYSVNARREVSADRASNRISRDLEPAIRLLPVDNSPKSRALSARIVSGPLENPRFATLPSKNLRFRVEVDNEPVNAELLLRIDRSKLRDFADPDEVINLGFPKDQRVWLDLAGPEKTLLLTNTVADHIGTVDVSALRGLHELQGVLRYKVTAPEAKDVEVKFVYNLIVDDTPPPADDIKVGPFPKRHERGKLLPVFVSAVDPDTLIERVKVVVGKPGPDGKFPPEAVAVDAESSPFGWVANIQLPTPAPVPPPPPGTPPPPKEPIPPIDITVIAENEVGLTTAKVVRIELVEPAGGTLVIRVERGGRPQPDTPVTLLDAEGKEKGAGKTDKKGEIKFLNLPPGVYKASAIKEDSSYGIAGFVATEIPNPPPPPGTEILSVMKMVKRR